MCKGSSAPGKRTTFRGNSGMRSGRMGPRSNHTRGDGNVWQGRPAEWVRLKAHSFPGKGLSVSQGGSNQDKGRFTQAEFWREDSRTAEMNSTPATPSSTRGTSSDEGAGGRPA